MVFALACGREVEDTAWRDGDTAIASDDLFAFKQAHPHTEIAASTALMNEYADLLAAYAGVESDAYQQAMQSGLAGPLSGLLSEAQTQAYAALTELVRGRASVSWDPVRGTPTYVNIDIRLAGATGIEAKDAFDEEVGGIVAGLLALGTLDELEIVDERAFDLDPEEPSARVHRFRYAHLHESIHVHGDWLEIALTTSNETGGTWIPRIRARWTKDIALPTTTPTVSWEVAVASAMEQGDVADPIVTEPQTVVIWTGAEALRLAYRVSLAQPEPYDPWRYHIDAATADLLASSNQVAHNSGTLKHYVGRPHEGNSKFVRGVPSVWMWEDTVFDANYPMNLPRFRGHRTCERIGVQRGETEAKKI